MTLLSTGSERRSLNICCGSDLYLRGGLGLPRGGGDESLRDTEQKTVGPSHAKIRKIARAPVIWDPIVYKNMKPYSNSENLETLILCVFFYIRRHHLLSTVYCAISLQNDTKNGGFSRKKQKKQYVFHSFQHLFFYLAQPVWIPKSCDVTIFGGLAAYDRCTERTDTEYEDAGHRIQADR